MGYYIQVVSAKNKAKQIEELYGGMIIAQPKNFSEIPKDWALIVVVDNGPFEAAAFAYSEAEFKVFMDPTDKRPKQFLVIEWNKACRLSGYKE